MRNKYKICKLLARPPPIGQAEVIKHLDSEVFLWN